jgi:hypothetical protein
MMPEATYGKYASELWLIFVADAAPASQPIGLQAQDRDRQAKLTALGTP